MTTDEVTKFFGSLLNSVSRSTIDGVMSHHNQGPPLPVPMDPMAGPSRGAAGGPSTGMSISFGGGSGKGVSMNLGTGQSDAGGTDDSSVGGIAGFKMGSAPPALHESGSSQSPAGGVEAELSRATDSAGAAASSAGKAFDGGAQDSKGKAGGLDVTSLIKGIETLFQ